MKFTVLPDYSGGVFKTVSEQLQELYPYIMGKYTQGVVDENGTVLGSKLNLIKKALILELLEKMENCLIHF